MGMIEDMVVGIHDLKAVKIKVTVYSQYLNSIIFQFSI